MTLQTPSTPRTLFGHPLAGLLHLFVVYAVWGSTFLAIRVAVREGAGWDPWSMAGSRLILAGPILLLWARSRRQRVLPHGREWLQLLVYALLIWVGGHGLTVWAEERVPSGQAALVVGSSPVIGAMIAAALDRKAPTWKLIGGVLLGFAGLMVLIEPHQAWGSSLSTRLPAVLVGVVFWTFGVIIQARWRTGLESLASSGWQQLLASGGFLVLWLLLRDGELPSPSPEAWLAWTYLLVFGSLLAFTSYVRVMQLLPTPLVLTHAYVNPVVAVLLGWLILGELVTVRTLVGAALILLGVAGVFHARPAAESKATD